MPLKCQKKAWNKSFSWKKVPQKIREVHSLPQIPHTLEQEERRGASGSSSSITTNFRVSLGSRNRFFRCLSTKQRIFCGLAIIFSWTRGMSSPFSHLSRSVTRSGSSVTRGLFSAWSSSRHDGQPHHGIVQSMSCWWMSFKSFNKSFHLKKKYSAFRQTFPKLWTNVSHSFLQQIAQNKNWGHPKANTLPRIYKVEMEHASLLFYLANPNLGAFWVVTYVIVRQNHSIPDVL